jgi:hypothetical protein
LQAHGFRYYFTSLTADLFTFPSRYLFTVGHQRVFSLMPWSAWIHTKCHVDRVTQEFPRRCRVFGYGSFTLCGATFQKLHLTVHLPRRAPTTPEGNPPVWAVPLSFATTDGIASLSFPHPTEMFHFRWYGSTAPMYSERCAWLQSHAGYPIRRFPGRAPACG